MGFQFPYLTLHCDVIEPGLKDLVGLKVAHVDELTAGHNNFFSRDRMAIEQAEMQAVSHHAID